MKNILLLLFSIIFAACLAEATIRYVIYFIPIDIIGSPTVISDHGYTLNPSSGTGRHQVGKIVVQYHFYPYHLRDTPMNPNATHILVLGDSFTFGWLLPWDSTHIHRLQIDADNTFGKNKYQFLDAATGGWGAADYLSYLEDYGAETSPKIVIVFLNTDDIGRAIKRNMYKLTDTNSLKLVESFHPVPYAKLKTIVYDTWLFKHSLLLHFIRYIASNLLHIQSRPMRDNIAQSNWHRIPVSKDIVFQNDVAVLFGEAIFRRMNQWCKQHHAKLLVVTTGFNAFYPSDLHDPTKAFLVQAPFFFEKEGISYYDMAVPFKITVAGKIFQIPGDQHPNEFGAIIMAKISWPWIKQKIADEGISG